MLFITKHMQRIHHTRAKEVPRKNGTIRIARSLYCFGEVQEAIANFRDDREIKLKETNSHLEAYSTNCEVI